jgi:large subunit ribosomal protein L35
VGPGARLGPRVAPLLDALARRASHHPPPRPRGGFLLLYFSHFMPKMKTHSGAKKRFKVTGTGKVRGRSAFTSHQLEHKSAKRKRRQAEPAVIHKADVRRVKKMLSLPTRVGK